MAEFFGKVAKFGKERLIVEIPKLDRESFSAGDYVIVRKITPQDVDLGVKHD